MDALILTHLKSATGLVAKKVGLFIKSQLHNLHSDDIEVKDLNSLVSYVDIEAEKTIVSELEKLLPEAGFITEEETIAQASSEKSFHWIIDPLDGTTNFIHQLPFFAVSIALRYNAEYVIGVVYDIMHDRLFIAAKGQGASMNEKPIFVTNEKKLSEALLATGFPYNSFETMDAYLNLFRALFPKTRGIRRCGSAALDLCYVANGTFAGFFELGLNEWDVAAGICIVQEAGGQVSDFRGKDDMVEDRRILATNGLLHNELLSVVRISFIGIGKPALPSGRPDDKMDS